MENLWQKVCTHFAVPEDVSNMWFSRLKARLSEPVPSRIYHNWSEMMQHKSELLQHCKPSIILAAFFQYYQYDGQRSCVTENCAALEEFCKDAQLDEQQTKAELLYLLGHKACLDAELSLDCWEQDANLLQDLDLQILAAPMEKYQHYTQLLRREYTNMDDEHYKIMRLKVLETLLIIPNIYSTLEFQSKYEEAARNNIKHEIQQLK